MILLIQSIQRTCNIAEGWTVGQLVIESSAAYMELDNGSLIEVNKELEVKNGDRWQRLTAADLKETTREGWPVYAGMDARMM